jgi:hypothetical protein
LKQETATMKKKSTRRPREATKPNNAGAPTGLRLALLRLEQAGEPLREAIVTIKQSSKDLDNLLAHRNFFAHTTRALRTIAAEACENGEIWPSHKDCGAAIVAGEFTTNDLATSGCWPCYARHVLNGGTP